MKSIRKRLTVLLLLGFALLLGAGGVLIYFSARVALYKEFDSTLKIQALSMAALTKPGREKVEFSLPQKLIPATEASAGGVEYYQLFNANGKSLVRSPSLKQSDLPLQFGTLGKPEFWNLTLPDGTQGRAAGVRFTAKPPQPKEKRREFELEHAGNLSELLEGDEHDDREDRQKYMTRARTPVELTLVIADDRSRLEQALNALLVIVFGAGAATLLCATAMISLALRWGLTPLRRLADNAAQINAASLRTRFAAEAMPAELLPIVHTLNDLLARLEASFENERRFSADLAHELRTPIAGLRTTAEVALKYGDSNSGDRESFQSVLEIAQQMESMVNRLLTLARSEQRTLPIQPKPVPVEPLVKSLWEPLQARAAARGIASSISVAPDAVIRGDPDLLRGILINLLVNAADYTPAKGEIHVGFERNNGHFELTVANTVDNLAAADLPNLFQRFWRKDNARSDAEHTGLGLPLAKSFAELSGMNLSAELSGHDRLKLTLKGQAGVS